MTLEKKSTSLRALLGAFALSSFLVASAAHAAMDIGFVDIIWLHDRVDGAPISGTPYGIEIGVGGLEINSVQVTTPSGGLGVLSFTSDGPGEFLYDTAGTYASNATLMTDHPTGLWRFDFFSANGAFENDFFEITLNPVEMTNFIDIMFPAHNGTMSTTPTITWADCSGCAGVNTTAISPGLFDITSDIDADEATFFDLTTTSWNPSGLVAGHDYELEAIIGDYSHPLTTEATNGSDSFQFVAGFESINILNVAAVPEPGTGVLLGLGLIGLAVRRRVRGA